MKETTSSNSTRLTKRGVAAVAGLSMLASAGVANIVNDAQDKKRARDNQPICSIPVEYGDTISGIKTELKNMGDDKIWVTTSEQVG